MNRKFKFFAAVVVLAVSAKELGLKMHIFSFIINVL